MSRELVRIVCATCKGKWPTIASIVNTPTGLRFQSRRFERKVITTTAWIEAEPGESTSTPGKLRHVVERTDAALDDAAARFACGCPNGDGVVTIEREALLEWVDLHHRTNELQVVELRIAPNDTIYRLG